MEEVECRVLTRFPSKEQMEKALENLKVGDLVLVKDEELYH